MRREVLRGSLGFPHPDPTARDHHFRKERAYWIWLTFKNGQVMAGLFGANSFASSFPQRQDLFVEKLLSLDEDGNVVGWKDGSTDSARAGQGSCRQAVGSVGSAVSALLAKP